MDQKLSSKDAVDADDKVGVIIGGDIGGEVGGIIEGDIGGDAGHDADDNASCNYGGHTVRLVLSLLKNSKLISS